MKKPRLTGKQKRWADAYIVTLNQTESSRIAGYEGDDNSLAVQGHHNIRNPKILAYINSMLDTYAMQAYEVLVQLTDIARSDIADALTSTGMIDPLEAKKRGKSHLIKRFKTKTITTTDKNGEGSDIHEMEIEMYDRLKALDLLAKYHHLTTTTRIEDWRSDAIADIRNGEIDYAVLAEEFSPDLATELFAAAGVSVQMGTGSEEK